MKNIRLIENEHVEILGNDIGVIVSDEHTFGTDAMLLANFSNPRRKDVACDLGSGCGIIPLLWVRDNCCEKISAVEIQPKGCNQLNRSVEANNLENKLFVYNNDLKNLKGILNFGSFDLVTMNPPYKAENCGIVSEKENEKIARHETYCNIDDICKTAAALLKFSGRFCVCIRPERMFETMLSMSKNKLEPKRLRLVTSKKNQSPWLCLIEARLGGKSGLKIEPNFILYDDDNTYTQEMLNILQKYREEK